MKPIQAVIFDLGNVLIHVDEPRLVSRLAARTGKPATDLAAFCHRSPLIIEYGAGRCSSQEFYSKAKQTLGLDLPFEEFAEIWSNIFSPIADSLALALELKGQLPRVILSNTNALHADYFMREFPVLHDFDGHVFSQEVGLLKPDARIYELTLRKFGLEAERTVFFDDLAPNIDGARAVGLQGIQFHDAAQMRRALIALGVALRPSADL